MLFRSRTTLPELTAALVRATRDRDERATKRAYRAVATRAQHAGTAQLTAAATILAPLLDEVPPGAGAHLAVLAGGLIDLGATPAAVLEPLARRVAEGLELAAAFPVLWAEATGADEPPAADDAERLPEVLDKLGDPHARSAAEAWFTADEWVPGLLVALQRKEARRVLAHRDRLTAAARGAEDLVASATWLLGLLLVIDDEQAVVLHRESGRGYRVTFGGIGDNFQLHTLLAATLIGDPTRGLIAGTPPVKEWIDAATDGELQPTGGIHGQFNLVDAYGEWIWNEGRPADIPLMDGRRVIVLDPPPYPRSWNAGRLYPLMRPTLALDTLLAPEEAARWLAKVAPDQRAR